MRWVVWLSLPSWYGMRVSHRGLKALGPPALLSYWNFKNGEPNQPLLTPGRSEFCTLIRYLPDKTRAPFPYTEQLSSTKDVAQASYPRRKPGSCLWINMLSIASYIFTLNPVVQLDTKRELTRHSGYTKELEGCIVGWGREIEERQNQILQVQLKMCISVQEYKSTPPYTQVHFMSF